MMFRLVIKEWKESRFTALAALVVGLGLVLAWKVFSARPGIGDILAGTLFLVALPLMAMLFGARGFSSELQAGTWGFLSSRPIPRGRIWTAKYLSSLILVLAIYGLFASLTLLFPQARNILATVPFDYGVYGGKSILALGALFSVLLFHVAFALSFLTPKLMSIIFVSLMIPVGLALLLFGYYQSLQFLYPYLVGLNGIFIFVSASFAAASLLTYLKADLSQPKKARALFSKYAAGFVAGSLVLSAGLTWIGGSFIGPSKFVWNLTEHASKVFFTSNRGVMAYDPAADEVQALGKRSWRVMPFSLSLGGDKVVLLNYSGWRGMTQELWVMDTDGTRMKLLSSAREKNSPFFDHFFSGCRVSADGRKIALLTLPKGSGFARNYPCVLWWMNADGTGAKSLALREPLNPKGAIQIVGWTKSNQGLILYQFGNAPVRSIPKLVVFDLASGTGRLIVDDLPVFSLSAVSPLRDFFVRDFRDDRDQKKVISILDLDTFVETEIRRTEGLGVRRIRWTPDGEAFAFLDWRGESRLEKLFAGVYSVRKGEFLSLREMDEAPISPQVFPDIAWIEGGAALAFGPAGRAEPSIEVLSPELKVTRRFPVPRSFHADRMYAFLGAGSKIVVGVGPDKDLWRLDLATGGWRKIF